MAEVKVVQPRSVVISYRQEKTDADYGHCLWARFYFDLDNYTLSIESDCGVYGYGWVPTHKSESFLHLMARCEGGYILDKIASRSVIDEKATYDKVVEALCDSGITKESLPDFIWKEIKSCCSYDAPSEIVRSIYDALDDTIAESPEDEYDFWDCIEKDYPAGARKITEVFETHIRPVLRELRDTE